MKSSPVRDILAVLGRGDIISFAGGIPDPTLFELADFRESFAYTLEHYGPRALQYASTIGEPELRQQAAKRMSRSLADRTQPGPGDERFAGGPLPRGDDARRPGRRHPRRAPHLPHRRTSIHSCGRTNRGCRQRRVRDDAGRPRGRHRDPRPEARLPHPDVPEPHRPHDVGRAPGSDRRGARPYGGAAARG